MIKADTQGHLGHAGEGDHGMTMRRLPQLPGMTLAMLLTLAVVPALIFGPEAQAAGGRGLEGTWLNDVKIVTCSEPRTVLAQFSSMTSFMRGGILIESGAPPPPLPAVSQSVGHGIWERTGPHTFRAFFRGHSYDRDGHLVRITEVEGHPELIKGDNPETPDVVEPYYLRGPGTNRITIFDPANDKVTVTHGCNEATARPFF